jgi:transcriptional regulator with XRE-family HTH domain
MYELGERSPDHETMKRIAKIFNVSMDYLYEKETEPSLSELKLAILDVIDQIPEEQQRAFLEMAKIYRDSLKKD